MKRSWSFGLAAAVNSILPVGSPSTPTSQWQLDFEVETETQASLDSDMESDTSEEALNSFLYDEDDYGMQFQFDDESFLEEKYIKEHALADLKALPKASPLVSAQKIKLDVSVNFQEKARAYHAHQQKAAQLKKRKRVADTPGALSHDWNLTPRPFKEVASASVASGASDSLWIWEDTIMSSSPSQTVSSVKETSVASEHQLKKKRKVKKKQVKKKKKVKKQQKTLNSHEVVLKAALTAAETIQQLGKDAAYKPPATLEPNSVYKGVSRGKRTGTWQAKLTLTTKEGKRLRWNGTFEDQRSAAEAYDKYVRDAVAAGHRPGDMRALQRWKKMKKEAAKREAQGLSFDCTLSVDYEYHPEVNFPISGSGEKQATRQKRWGRTVTAPKDWGRIDPSKLSGKEQSWKATRADGTLVGHYQTELKALDELKKDYEQRMELEALVSE